MTDDSTLNGLLRAIIESPDDDMLRLVYADRLQECDESNQMRDFGAWFVRWQISGDTRGCSDAKFASTPYNLGWYVDKRHLWSRDNLSRIVYDMGGNSDPKHPQYGSYSWNVINIGGSRTVLTETGDVLLTYRRGFVDELRCTAAAFLRNADAIVWHPTQTMMDPTPFVLSEHECVTLSRSSEVRNYLMQSLYAMSDLGEWGLPKTMYGVPIVVDRNKTSEHVNVVRAIIERSRVRVPRPCPPTAQPIRRVVLTTMPHDLDPRSKTGSEIGLWLQENWPGVEFVLPSGTEAASDDNDAAIVADLPEAWLPDPT